MTPIERLIRSRIAARGPLPVAEYMALALADPEHGYYAARTPFGSAGDFVTAPEISQLFGEIVGLWCAITWRQIGAPVPLLLTEMGPGKGTLMADALRAAKAVPEFGAAAVPHLVETSAALERLQRLALGEFGAVWHRRLSELPAGPMVLIANEFFDALAVEQTVRTEAGWRRRCVGLDAATGGLCFTLSDAVVDEATIPPPFRAAPMGGICEVSPAAQALAGEIGDRIRCHGGAALIVDYGPARRAPGDTLQAVSRHRTHDVLADPGTADLTAHVDFQALAEAAAAAGAEAHGPVPQGVFLNRLGIAVRAERLASGATAGQAANILSGCRRLIDPAQMGTLFKAMALTRPGMPPPAGFEPEAEGNARC